MTTYQDKILKKCVKQFDGMTKIDAYDILYKIESLLIEESSPIEYKSIEKTIEKAYDIKNVLPVGSHSYCYLEDQCHYMQIYTFRSEYPTFLGGERTYFTIYNNYQMMPFDNKAVKEAFKDTNIGYILDDFLKDNHVKKRNTKTNRFVLLELFDQIDLPYKMVDSK